MVMPYYHTTGTSDTLLAHQAVTPHAHDTTLVVHLQSGAITKLL